MKKRLSSRILSLLLVLAILCGFAVPVRAQQNNNVSLSFEKTTGPFAQTQQGPVEAKTEEPEYTPTDVVRVSIVMEKKATLKAGFSTQGVAQNAAALAYRQEIRDQQTAITAQIEQAVGSRLDVQWNLTLAANIISANVAYGDIDTIRAVPGVQEVFLENRYEPCVIDEKGTDKPNMATSPSMIGSTGAYAAGYTGAGTKIAIIDTGLDMDHQSFDAAGFEYALSQLDGEYDLMDMTDIAAVLDQLNAKERTPRLTAERLYKNSKVPFGYNYVDNTAAYVDHDQDYEGGHGSHVAGIAAANAYVPNEVGTFSRALDTAKVQGVAPDAQLVVMKVFGKAGGAYDSDYMVAIEDAIVLGCDSINLSLGSANGGFGRSSTYEEVMDHLVNCGVTVAMSAGNAGHWADYSNLPLQGFLYGDDVSMHTSGSPGSFTNSLCVASVDNCGTTALCIWVAGKGFAYTESKYSNNSLSTLAGSRDYIFIDGFGAEEDFAALAQELEGKVAFCSRGDNSFVEKAENAVKYGAIATVIYNNQPGTIGMDLSSYTRTEPCVSITQSDANYVRESSTPVKADDGTILYYTGTMEIGNTVSSIQFDCDYYTMSNFSSYGVPGTLELKPEISAPGGDIYSVDGATKGGKAYVSMSGTSMASPQVAGMAALVNQHIRENGLDEQTGLNIRTLTQSLLMSTAVPMLEESSGNYYPVVRQGAGLANVGKAIQANSYILMDENATQSAKDGKVKVELLDDPERTGSYTFGLNLYNLRDEAQTYILSAELFTQGLFTEEGQTYLDTKTASLMADVTWAVDGQTLNSNLDPVRYDVTGDRLANGEDVQAILDHVLGKRETIGENTDVNGDGEITSYDAYLLLQKLGTASVTLPADGKRSITVTIRLTDAQKERLNEDYKNGAYLEGFLFVQQTATAEGLEGTSHSIPVLGFYGNWSDATMYDRGTLISRLYGDTMTPYATSFEQTNALLLEYANRSGQYYHTGNPYEIEETYPAGREAIRSDTVISQQTLAMIRNAAAATMIITNGKGELLHMEPVINQAVAAYYYVGQSSWKNQYLTYTLNQSAAQLGASEGDTITVSFVAIPELYEENGNLTEADVKALIESGRLGQGVYLSNTFQVDDTAPEVASISKDLVTGDLIVTARDNNYIAAIQVLKPNDNMASASAVPVQDGPGETTTTALDLSDAHIGETCYVVVADYAGNETVYSVRYDGETVSSEGKLFGFTSANYRGSGKRWMRIDPDTLYYVSDQDCAGTENLAAMNFSVTAAEYVDGNVYMASEDGYLYVGTQDVWNDCVRANYFGNVTTRIRDLAFNYQNNTLYALGTDNDIYSVDLTTCKLTKVADVSVTNPAVTADMYKNLIAMTIDDDGNFYVTNYGNIDSGFLYRFTLEHITDGKITDLAPVVNSVENSIGFYCYVSSMAWDHDNDVLYMTTTTSGLGYCYFSYLLRVDTETGKGELVNKNYEELSPWTTNGSKLYTTVYGLYVVPAKSSPIVPVTEATGVELDHTEVRSIVNSRFTLDVQVYPWNLEDKSVTWTSSDSSVAVVTDGMVETVGLGAATITATTHAAPNYTASCVVRVESLDQVNLSAMITDADGGTYWADFTAGNPAGWEAASEKGTGFRSGTIKDGVLYVHDGNHLYAYDPDSFQLIRDCGPMQNYWVWSDAAPAPAIGDQFDKILGVCSSGNSLELLDPEERTVIDLVVAQQDLLCAVAYCGTGVADYTPLYASLQPDCPANFYYVLTEGGELWYYEICAYESYGGAISYGMNRFDLGNIGIVLPGAALADGKQAVSMLYDEASGYLLLSVYSGGNTTQMYAIDPETQIAFPVGDFGNQVCPVTCLYHYERISALTVRAAETASMFLGDKLPLTAQVLPVTYENKVTWSSSDPNVATVDANGVVTGLKEGTVTITATSVAVNEAGEHACASCQVTIHGLAQVQAQVNAQIVTENGTQWATIDTGSRTITTLAEAETTLTGAGAHDGKLYGTNSNFVDLCYIWQIDPENGFAEEMGSACVPLYAFRDMTTAPGEPISLVNEMGETVTLDAFGYPAFINDQMFGFVRDPVFGTLKAFGMGATKNDVGAVAYMGDTTYEMWNGTVYRAKLYYALGADGTMYQFLVYANYDYYDQQVGYTLLDTALGNIGVTFEDPTAMTMTYVQDGDTEGLMIGYNGLSGAELYFVDLTQESLSCHKIGILPGANAISGLYTDGEQSRPANEALVFHEATAERSSSPQSFAHAPTQAIEGEDISMIANPVNGSVNAMVTGNAPEPADAATEKSITLEITAKDHDGSAVAATNGVATVEFQADKLELTGITVHADYKSIEMTDGTVKFAYAAGEEIPAGQPIATLTFSAKPCTVAEITVTHQQVNREKPVYTEKALASAHELVRKNAREATCTEDGYTGDEVCTICGKTIKTGEVIPAHCASKAFQDVNTTKWYHEYVDYVVDNGIMKGLPGNQFVPDSNMTRAMLVTTLYRMSGEPAVAEKATFADVKDGIWYSDAIAWAEDTGIVRGITATAFAPNASATREQAATILYRYVTGYLKQEPTEGANLSVYKDADKISPYARKAIAWATAQGLFGGFPNGAFQPKDALTRAQAAKLLTILDQKF